MSLTCRGFSVLFDREAAHWMTTSELEILHSAIFSFCYIISRPVCHSTCVTTDAPCSALIYSITECEATSYGHQVWSSFGPPAYYAKY